jgi:hypothetical protein
MYLCGECGCGPNLEVSWLILKEWITNGDGAVMRIERDKAFTERSIGSVGYDSGFRRGLGGALSAAPN